VQQLHEEHPEVPVHVVDVIADRGLARTVAERTGVRHESPQLILLVRGSTAWSVSHFDVRADELAERLSLLVG
jgi:bacillithiol system protein YtxJ